MPLDRRTDVADGQIDNGLWQQLEQALHRQEDALRKGRWPEFEQALARSRTLAEQIPNHACSPDPELLRRLGQQYKRLALLAAAQKKDLQDRIRAVRRRRNLAGTYRNGR